MVVKNFIFMENYNSRKKYLQVKILALDIFTHMPALTFFKYDDFTVLQIKYLSYNMVVILLSSPLQPQSYTKVIPDEKATLMTGGFLLTYSMLEVCHE